MPKREKIERGKPNGGGAPQSQSVGANLEGRSVSDESTLELGGWRNVETVSEKAKALERKKG